MKKTLLFGSLSLLLIFVACGGRKVKLNEAIDQNSKSLSTAVEWVKNKGDSVDMNLTFHNGYSHPIHFSRGAIRATFNGKEGVLRQDKFDVNLDPGESLSETFIFRFNPKIPKEGNFVFSIDPIYQGKLSDEKKVKLPKYVRQFTM